uniref:Ig-like domain-containing protein n=1 Tax=Glossina morsitans morsitans TaxID=37546 RepID=A0A1B0FQ21_GLOMM
MGVLIVTKIFFPPNIDDSLSSSDVIVREGSNISLRCRATGSPKPVIKWKRDDNSRITISKNRIVNDWEGDTLEITRISRLDMGAYLCIASNGVPPTVSKRIKVSVDSKLQDNRLRGPMALVHFGPIFSMGLHSIFSVC